MNHLLIIDNLTCCVIAKYKKTMIYSHLTTEDLKHSTDRLNKIDTQ